MVVLQAAAAEVPGAIITAHRVAILKDASPAADAEILGVVTTIHKVVILMVALLLPAIVTEHPIVTEAAAGVKDSIRVMRKDVLQVRATEATDGVKDNIRVMRRDALQAQAAEEAVHHAPAAAGNLLWRPIGA